MDCIRVIGGVKAEIKSETHDDIVEIGLEDIFDDDYDPFDVGEDDGEILDKDRQLKQPENSKINLSRGSETVSKLNFSSPSIDKSKEIKIKNGCKESRDIENDKSQNTKDSKAKSSQIKEILVLNYTKNEDLLDDNSKKKLEEVENEMTRKFDQSGAYKTFEGTSTRKDLPKVIVTRVPTSYVADTEYTIEDYGKYRCNHCQFRTTTKKFVTKHIRYKHRKETKMYECPYCSFKSKYSLRYHIISVHKTDNEVEWFRCNQCNFKSKLKAQLAQHSLTHLDPSQMMDRMKKCDQCPKMFKYLYGLQRHKRLIHENQPMKKLNCPECDYQSAFYSQIKNHVEVYHSAVEKELIKCSECSYKTIHAHKLKAHCSARHRDNKIQCEKCAYQTDMMFKMNLHMINHKEVKDETDLKYRCDKCDYKTYRTYSLQVHKLNHLKPEEIQYFYCYHCKFKAKRKDNLKTHVLRHFKLNEVAFQCFSCKFTTKKREEITAHINKHSKDSEKKKKTKTGCSTTIDKPVEKMEDPKFEFIPFIDKESKEVENAKA